MTRRFTVLLRTMFVLPGVFFMTTACNDVRDSSAEANAKAGDQDAIGAPMLQLVDTVRLVESDTMYVARAASFLAASDGTYLLADLATAVIHHYSADGRLLQRFGKRGQGPGELTAPEKMALVRDSLLYVADDLKFLEIFEYATGAFVRQVRPDRGLLLTLAAQGNRVLFNALDRERRSTVASIDVNDRVETGGPFPPPLGRSRVLDEFFSAMHIAPIGGHDTIAVAIMSNRNVFVGSFPSGAFEGHDVATRRRWGSRDDLMAHVTDENLQAAQDAVNKLSMPVAVTGLSTGHLAYVAADDSTVENRSTRRLYLSLVDRKKRRSCVDALVPANTDPRPLAAFRGDTLVVLDRTITSATNEYLVLRKYVIDTESCEWVAAAA